MVGFTLFFSHNAVDRKAKGDARSSIEERYVSRDAYLSEVRTSAESLVADRYLLPEDIDVVVENCARTYDQAVSNAYLQA
jgi:hypothetical protein